MTDDEVQVAGAKHKLAQAKNSKEYMAAQREIEQRARGAGRARGGDRQAGRGGRRQEEAAGRPRRPTSRRCKASIAKDGDAAKARMAEIEAQDRRAARRARQAGRQRAARRAQALQQHPYAPRAGGRQRPQRHLPGLQHEHPAAALQRPAARPDGRDLSLLPPDHLLGGDHEGRSRAGGGSSATTPATASAPQRFEREAAHGAALYARSACGIVRVASRSSRTGGRGGAFKRPSRKVRAPQGRVLANGQSR